MAAGAVFMLAVVSAGTAVMFTMMFSVVAACHVRIIRQRAGQKRLDSLIRIALDAAVEGNAGLCKGCFGASADTAADKSIHGKAF